MKEQERVKRNLKKKKKKKEGNLKGRRKNVLAGLPVSWMTQGYVHPTNKTETRPLKWDEGRRDMTSLMACADIPLWRSSRGKVIFYFEQFDSLVLTKWELFSFVALRGIPSEWLLIVWYVTTKNTHPNQSETCGRHEGGVYQMTHFLNMCVCEWDLPRAERGSSVCVGLFL